MKKLNLFLGCFCIIIGCVEIPIRLTMGKTIDNYDAIATLFCLFMGLVNIFIGLGSERKRKRMKVILVSGTFNEKGE